MNLEGKKILLGITGGIAAYKSLELIRMYKREGAEVKAVLTPNALEFVTPLTIQTLTNNKVYINNFDTACYNPEHISLCEWSDILVIAPATANTIAKIANGICDNLLTSLASAYHKPFLIAPAMNCNMYTNPVTQENISKLSKLGYNILAPEDGFLACGTNGAGRLASLEKIYSKTLGLLNPIKPLNNKKILITAGGTIEKIDPVRYISNFSSGKMGAALAETAANMGAEVTLISTFKANGKLKNIVVQSAEDMLNTILAEFDYQDCIIMAAAVADWKVKNYNPQKVKKLNNIDNWNIELIKNPDILKTICLKRSEKGEKVPLIVGFSAESENLLENAKKKIRDKGCDFIIANDISKKDFGFSSDYNEVYIINKNLSTKFVEKCTKQEAAKVILESIFEQTGNNIEAGNLCPA